MQSRISPRIWVCYGNAIIVLWEIKMERKYGKIKFDKELGGWVESHMASCWDFTCRLFRQILIIIIEILIIIIEHKIVE